MLHFRVYVYLVFFFNWYCQELVALLMFATLCNTLLGFYLRDIIAYVINFYFLYFWWGGGGGGGGGCSCSNIAI